MKKTVILGGTGYIGTNMAARFEANGHDVTRLGSRDVNLLHYHEATNKLVEHFEGADNLLICSAITRTTGDDLDSCFVNLEQIKTILAACRRLPPKNIVYLSAADVYGHGGIDVDESTTALHPMNDYGTFKVFTEHLLRVNLSDISKLVILRFSGVFGGIDDRTSLIYRFVETIKANKTITLSYNGKSIRDFVPIRLLTEAAFQLAEGKHSGIFNVSTGERIDIISVVKLIARQLSRYPQVNLKISPDVSERDFDLSLSNKKLTETLHGIHIPQVSEAIALFVGDLNNE